MKWIRRVSIAMVILVCGLGGYAISTALRTERPVGFQIAQATYTDGQTFVSACGIQRRRIPGR